MVSGWLILICCERKTLLNGWLILADKIKRTKLNVSKYESLILYDKHTSYISVSRYRVCNPISKIIKMQCVSTIHHSQTRMRSPNQRRSETKDQLPYKLASLCAHSIQFYIGIYNSVPSMLLFTR
jgi:Tfp pilus assembly protein PilP